MKFRTMLMASALAVSSIGFGVPGARGRRQGSADAALVDLRRRSGRAERAQAGPEEGRLRLEGRPGRRRRRRRRDDGAEGDGRRRQSADRLADSRLFRHRLRRSRQARRHDRAGEEGRLGQGRSHGAAEVHHHQRQVGRRAGQHPLGQLDLDQQGGDGQDRRDRTEDLRRIHRAARQGQEGRRHSARARRPALAGSDDVRLASSLRPAASTSTRRPSSISTRAR